MGKASKSNDDTYASEVDAAAFKKASDMLDARPNLVWRGRKRLTIAIDVPLPRGTLTYPKLVVAFDKAVKRATKLLLAMAEELTNGQDGTR
jgi:hypothetical protein